MKVDGEIILYQSENSTQLEVRIENETVWLTQAQMVELFQRDVSVISRHISNIFKEGELDKKSNLHFLQIAFSDKPIILYSLDVIISVGYRVNSINATKFRIWANSILKESLMKGYVLNNRIERIEKKIFTKSHDRFLIIDNEEVYHIGASLKDLAKKWFAFSKIELDANELIIKLEN